jgi:ABC-type transport system involved in multi-copper enzyme maturation permease subunit
MVIFDTDVTPFFTWLFGPGWTEGALFHPLFLVLLILLIGAAVTWCMRSVRKGTGATSRKTGVWLSVAMLLGSLLGVVAFVLLRVLPKVLEAKWEPPLQSLLGNGWYQGAAYHWVAVVLAVVGLAFVVGLLLTALRRGPREAFAVSGQVVGDAVLDFLRLSPRRAVTLAWLAVKESIRRRVVVVFVVFGLILLFAGWFLDTTSTDPARLYLNFMLSITSYLLVLPLALFLSSLSLPADIKNRTLHTIVTKPVRSSEVVLGRILGFTAVITALLAFIGLATFVFVERGLSHTHELVVDAAAPAKGGTADKPVAGEVLTSRERHHRHRVAFDRNGDAAVQMEQRHKHSLVGEPEIVSGKDGKTKLKYHLGPPEELLMARVPVRGKLTFLDRAGQPTDKGISVGDEWTYRSFIEGGSSATAIFTFHDITEDRFPDGLPIEMTLGVFRTYKGDIERGVLGSIYLENPKTHLRSHQRIFVSKEYVIDLQQFGRDLQTPEGKKIDLFKDIVNDGTVKVCLQCAEKQQYFGVAPGDMYLRAPDASFALNFVKGYLGIWLQALILISLGVMFSTFLSGPVAMLATIGALVGGFCHQFMLEVGSNRALGGGLFESIWRMLTQQNQTSELEAGWRTSVVQGLDQVLNIPLRLLAEVLPDFGRFNFSEYVASGFNIPGGMALQYTCRAFAFALPVFVAGYLFLKNREVAQQ